MEEEKSFYSKPRDERYYGVGGFIVEIIKIFLLAFVIIVPIRVFLFQPFFVQGASMEPNFENGDYLIVDELSYRFREPQRGEVIVFKYPGDRSQRYIKRIIGLPGETIEIKEGEIVVSSQGKQYVLDESRYLSSNFKTPGKILVTLGQNEYFVLGDNRFFSYDSRRWGLLPKEDLIGRVFLRILPFTALAKIEAPAY